MSPTPHHATSRRFFVATTKSKVLLAILFLTCAGVFAAERTSAWEGIGPNAEPPDLGILFNTNDILLDIEGFQGGVGSKISLKEWMLRGSADLIFRNQWFSFDLGAVLEKHLLPGPISPYWGPAAAIGYTLDHDKDDEDNWSREHYPFFSLGCVFGIEVFIFQFLSLFVEYQAALKLGLDITKVNVAGSVSTTKEFTYDFDIGMGNNAKFGIVIYLKKRNDSTSRGLAEQE
jgi:hypothetical protein